MGNQQRTASGRYCQSWSSQDPHKHPFDPSRYPTELLTSSLSCRNPGGVGEGPWCYTSDPNVRWEYCDVPQCGRSKCVLFFSCSIIRVSDFFCLCVLPNCILFLLVPLSFPLSLSLFLPPPSLSFFLSPPPSVSLLPFPSLPPFTEVCEQYGGGFCSAVHGYDDSNMTVYVNRSHTHWGASGQSAIERFLSGIFEDLSSVAETQTWTPGCEFAVRQLLCHTTLPFCQDQGE